MKPIFTDNQGRGAARRWLAVFVAMSLGLLVCLKIDAEPTDTDKSVRIQTAEGFAIPQPGHVFEFPRDHGSHPEFKIEWWYVTGHLFSEDGRRFGFQATFFRQAGKPKSVSDASGARESSPNFEYDPVYLAHMAVVDVQTGRFIFQEKLNREGWDAGATRDQLEVHNGPWSLRMTDPANGHMELHGGVRGDALFSLGLKPLKPLVVFGENSVSRKGAEPSAASYYLTYSRLETHGELELGSENYRVTGDAWMDHEISSSQLGSGQVGWDWVSVQLTDGREIMLYRLRLADGRADPASSLTWVLANGQLEKADFKWEDLDRWTSPATGANYPSRIRLSTTDPATHAAVSFEIEPLVRNQELTGGIGGVSYWEGACRVRDEKGRELGSAYVELTGYAKKLQL
jgi:predicted secreted hydrolase